MTKTIQDFPIRSHAAFLKLRRRRWRHKETGATLSRELSFIAEGSRFTNEVAAFLKNSVENRLDPISVVAHYFGIKVDTARRHYKKKWSAYQEWDQKPHAQHYLLFPENLRTHIAIDEVSLTRGELYTLVIVTELLPVERVN